MSQARTIFINVIASHARSVYALVVGLLTGRWALLALGHESYGLFGLVGGLIAFVSLFNMIFSNSVVRYYAVAIGESQGLGDEGIVNCRKWFNVVLLTHIAIPLFLLVIGYPVGVWMVRHFLVIPPDRVENCVWVFRFTCLSCFVGMVNVPFNAMFVAKQYIAELTVYSFAMTTAHLFVLWYFVDNPGDWLIPMAAWYSVQTIVPALIISLRALIVFPECRIVPRFMVDGPRLRSLFSFAGWQFLGSVGMMIRNQGVGILINKYLGAVFNATGTVSSTISCQTQTFANAVNSAFAPAISTAYGSGDRHLMAGLVNRCNKFSALLVMMLALPLCLEMDYVVSLWLKEPPPLVSALAVYSCGVVIMNKITCGHEVAINACGRIASMQVFLFACYAGVAALTWIAFAMGGGVLWAGFASLTMMGCISLTRIGLARTLVGLSSREWFRHTFSPLLIVAIVTILVAAPVKLLFAPSIIRVVLVCGTAGVVLMIASWFVVMTIEEKKFVVEKIKVKLGQ